MMNTTTSKKSASARFAPRLTLAAVLGNALTAKKAELAKNGAKNRQIAYQRSEAQMQRKLLESVARDIGANLMDPNDLAKVQRAMVDPAFRAEAARVRLDREHALAIEAITKDELSKFVAERAAFEQEIAEMLGFDLASASPGDLAALRAVVEEEIPLRLAA